MAQNMALEETGRQAAAVSAPSHLSRIALLMATAALLLAWAMRHTEASFADGLRYIRQAEQFDRSSASSPGDCCGSWAGWRRGAGFLAASGGCARLRLHRAAGDSALPADP